MTLEEDINQQLEQRIATAEAEGRPKTVANLIEHNLAQVERIVANLRAQEEHLEQEIAARQTRLRQTRTSIDAFTLAIERLRP